MREPPVPTKQAKMVGWYNADVLAQSAWMMTVANLFGRHSDSRLIEALSNQPQGVFRFETDAPDGEFWFDFVSDVGDGFNPTYTVARGIAAAELDVEGADGAVVHTRAGSVLVFGGDQVYPYPTRGAYEERTEAPYAAACAAARRSPLAVRDENLRSVDGSIVPTAGVGVEDRFAAIVQRIAGDETRCHA